MSGQRERWDGLDHSDQLDPRDATLDLTRMIEQVRKRIEADARGQAGPGNGSASAAPDWRPEERWQEPPQAPRNGSHAAPPGPDVAPAVLPDAPPDVVPAEAAAARPEVTVPGPEPAAVKPGVPAAPSEAAGSQPEAGSRAEAGPGAAQVRAADLAWRPTERPVPGSLADLRQRLERLPRGHPSSPYHVDGERKPPPPRLRHLELAPPAPGRAGLDRPPLGQPDQDLPDQVAVPAEAVPAEVVLAEAVPAEVVLAEAGDESANGGDFADAELADAQLADAELADAQLADAQLADAQLADAQPTIVEQSNDEQSTAAWADAEPTVAPAAADLARQDRADVEPAGTDMAGHEQAEPDLTGAHLADPASADAADREPARTDLFEPDRTSAGHLVPDLADVDRTIARSPARSPVFVPRDVSAAHVTRPSQPRFEPTRPPGSDPYLPSGGRAGTDQRRPDWVARADSPSTTPVLREPDRRSPRLAPQSDDSFPGTGPFRRPEPPSGDDFRGTGPFRRPEPLSGDDFRGTGPFRRPELPPGRAGNGADHGPPRLAADGSWAWGPARLTRDQLRIADEAYDEFREAEGRDMFGVYHTGGLTARLLGIANRLEHGQLAPDAEDRALLPPDVFRARLADMIRRHPERTPDQLARRVPGTLSYSFMFSTEHYSDGIWLVQDALEAQSVRLQARKNGWSGAQNRCVFTMWRDSVSGLPFEVQFHTAASFEAQRLARTSASRISDPRTAPAEAANLSSTIAEAWASLTAPPGNEDIADYRRSVRAPAPGASRFG